MKIKKFQGGGFATFTPIINIPPAQQQQTSGSSEKSENESASVLDDKLLETLYKEGGLVNDVNQLVSELIKIEQSSSNPYLQGQNRTSTLQLISKINEVHRNRKYWEDAVTRSKESGGLGEVAVADGRVFMKTKDNKIKSISLTEYNNNRNKIDLLSVQELLYERQYNPSLTGQNAIFTVADNAIGINKITSHIQDIIKNLGSNTETYSKFYSKAQVNKYLEQANLEKPTSQEAASLVALFEEIKSTPGDYFQVKTTNKTEKGQIGVALNYIWDTLSNSAQQKLTATAAMNGVKNPKEFILNMLSSQSDNTNEVSIIPKDLPEDFRESGSTKGLISWSSAELFIRDQTRTPGATYSLNNENAKVILKATATGIAPWYSITDPNQIVNEGPLPNVLNATGYKAVVDQSKAYIGDVKVNPLSFAELAYTGDDVGKVYIPVKDDGTPDLAQMALFNKAYEIFQENKDDLTVEELQTLFSKSGFQGIKVIESIDENGRASKIIGESNKVKPFLAVPVITNAASELSEIPWMNKMIGENKDRAKALLEKAFGIVGGTPSKPKIINTQPEGNWWWSSEDPFQGVLLLEFRREAATMVTAANKNLKGPGSTTTQVYTNANFTSGTVNPVTGIVSSGETLNRE